MTPLADEIPVGQSRQCRSSLSESNQNRRLTSTRAQPPPRKGSNEARTGAVGACSSPLRARSLDEPLGLGLRQADTPTHTTHSSVCDEVRKNSSENRYGGDSAPPSSVPRPPRAGDIPVLSHNQGTGPDMSTLSRADLIRKTSVAVAGTALIVAGVPLVPLPGPGDFMILGGVALLATEFPAAQRVLDGTRDKLVEVLGDDEDEIEETAQEKEQIGTCIATKEGRESVDAKQVAIDSEKEWVDSMEKGIQDAKRGLKKSARKMGKQVLPLFEKLASNRSSNDDDESLSVLSCAPGNQMNPTSAGGLTSRSYEITDESRAVDENTLDQEDLGNESLIVSWPSSDSH